MQYVEKTLLQNIEVFKNYAHEGAGIWISGSTNVTLVNVLAHNNHAHGSDVSIPNNRGSGLFLEASNVKMVNMTAANNSVEGYDGYVGVSGGDVYCVNMTAEFDNCIIAGDVYLAAVSHRQDYLVYNNSLVGSMSLGRAGSNSAYPIVVFNNSIVGPTSTMLTTGVFPNFTFNNTQQHPSPPSPNSLAKTIISVLSFSNNPITKSANQHSKKILYLCIHKFFT